MRCSTGSILALTAALSGCSGVYLQPDRRVYARPADVGAVWEEARFRAPGGPELAGAWFPARQGPPKAVVVQFHGNAENMTAHFLSVYWLAPQGYDVLVFDYRGYGASEGKKSLAGAVADGAAALAYARSKAPGLPLVVIGQSLGGAIALASLDRDGGAGLKALALESTFSSYRGVARDKLGRWWLTRPVRGLLCYLFSDRYRPSRYAARRKPVPLAVLHAPGDPVVPYEQGRFLYEAAAGPKEWWEVAGSGHADAFTAHAAEFRPRLVRFLDAAVKP